MKSRHLKVSPMALRVDPDEENGLYMASLILEGEPPVPFATFSIAAAQISPASFAIWKEALKKIITAMTEEALGMKVVRTVEQSDHDAN